MRQGSLLKSHGSWFVKVYIDKKQRAFNLGPTRNFMSKREVRQEADRVLARMGMAGNMTRMSLDSFTEHWFLPVAGGKHGEGGRLRPSTALNYRSLWNKHIHGRTLAAKPLWEFRTVHVQNLLQEIARDNPHLSRTTHQRIKAFLSVVFRHSIIHGFRDANPVRDALLPHTSAPRKQPGVYTLEEVRTVIAVLSGPARLAVAIAAYAGLRLAEIQGLRWENYDAKALTLEVRQTQWHGKESPPKSEASRNWLPVIPALADVLNAAQADSKPRTKYTEDGDEVPDTRMFDVDLVNLGRRTVRAAFKKCELTWRGWHPFRRGLATTLYQQGCDDLTVMRILRHSKVIVTRESYIRVRDPRVEDAMGRLSNAVQGTEEQGASKERSDA